MILINLKSCLHSTYPNKQISKVITFNFKISETFWFPHLVSDWGKLLLLCPIYTSLKYSYKVIILLSYSLEIIFVLFVMISLFLSYEKLKNITWFWHFTSISIELWAEYKFNILKCFQVCHITLQLDWSLVDLNFISYSSCASTYDKGGHLCSLTYSLSSPSIRWKFLQFSNTEKFVAIKCRHHLDNCFALQACKIKQQLKKQFGIGMVLCSLLLL